MTMRLIIFTATVLFLLSCNHAPAPVEQKSADLAEMQKYQLGIGQKRIDAIALESGRKCKLLKEAVWIQDTIQGKVVQADSIIRGIGFPRVDEATATRIVRNYLPEITPSGYYIFMNNERFSRNIDTVFYDIVIIKCRDQFELVKYAETEGPNYGVENTMVIEKLKKWNSESPFVIVKADRAGIVAEFTELPKDLNAFADELYLFCPDVIDQGAESKEELIRHIKTKKSFWLWWD